MDESQFDRLTTEITGSTGRRGVLGVLLGLAAVGSVLDETTGKSNREKRRRRRRRRNQNEVGAVGDQPDCAGVLTRAGCNRVHDATLQIDKWQCPVRANLQGADLSGCRMEHAVRPAVILAGAFLNRAVFNDADLHQADLKNATMDSVAAVNTRFNNAIMFNASMADCDLRNANFEGADVRLRDWSRTWCPDSIHIGPTRPTCCRNLNGHTAKFCGKL